MRTAVVTILLLAALPVTAQEHEHKLPAPLVELGGKDLTVPLTFIQGRPVVEVKINGNGPFRFYFDTGASGPVMSLKCADELKLKSFNDMPVRVRSGGDGPDAKPIEGKMVVIPDLELGTAKLHDLPIAAFDRARLGGDDAPVGVLSPNLFPEYLVTIDYPKQQLRIRPGALPAADGKTIFDYQKGKPIPSLVMTVAGREVEAHLDSGSGGGLSLPKSFADTLPLAAPAVDTKKRARSVSGDFPVYQGQLKGKATFGQFNYVDPTIEFSDVVRTGNLGAKILSNFLVTLDVKNRRFQLEQIAK
jgi:hypothetical protein